METTGLFISEIRNNTKSNNNDKECVGLQGRENF